MIAKKTGVESLPKHKPVYVSSERQYTLGQGLGIPATAPPKFLKSFSVATNNNELQQVSLRK